MPLRTPVIKIMRSLSNVYFWKDFRCVYTFSASTDKIDEQLALLLIHPIGVGLSGVFWQRFAQAWFAQGNRYSLYNPDLLGCGASEMPPVAYYPQDWAEQLQFFEETILKKPVVLVVQGALLPVALKFVQNLPQSNNIKGLVLSGPPAWRTITQKGKPRQQKLLWNLFFDSPLGKAFYRYARRRQFLRSFSERQLFAQTDAIDENWLDFLQKGAQDLDSRYAVFSFLAGFWREDYEKAIASIPQPTLVVFGDEASSISQEGKTEAPQERLEQYLKHLLNGQGSIIKGRNVLPYESTDEFASLVAQFVKQL